MEGILPIIAFLGILSVVVLFHEFGHFIIARRYGVRVEKFSFGFGPKLFGFKKRDTEYLVSLIPLGGYVKMSGDEYSETQGNPWEYLSKSVGERARIIIAGPLCNYFLAFILFCFIFMYGSPTLTNKVGDVLKDYPAAQAGIKKGDKLVIVDGKATKYWHELTEVIHNKKEGKLRILIERDGERFELLIKPKRRVVKDIFGKEHSISYIGITPSDEIVYVKSGLLESIKKGTEQLLNLTYTTYKAILFLVLGKMSVRETVTGPIGIYIITSKAVKLGFVYFIQMMAIISASLAIFNLLPVPALDGGHLIFILIEKIKGKAISPKVQERITQAGLALLIALMIFVFYNDIIRWWKMK